MCFATGAVVALAVSVGASLIGLDRDRSFYPVLLIIIASYYVLFAAMAESLQAMWVEAGLASLFMAAAVIGFRGKLWWVAVGLFAHGVFDLVHSFFIENEGVPVWWPAFCAAYDVMAGLCLLWVMKRRDRDPV